MKNIIENQYDLAINARKLLNESISQLELLKLKINENNTDPILRSEILKFENILNNQNKELKTFENEWM
jgi:hypothetical protein